MALSPTTTYSLGGVKSFFPGPARRHSVRLAPSKVFAAGTVMGEHTGAAEVQHITLTGFPTGGTFKLTFRGVESASIAYNAINAAVLAALVGMSTIGTGNVVVSGATLGTSGTDEVQTVTLTGSPTGGTFALGYNGQTTAAVAYNAAAATLETALEALSTIGAGNITVAGSAGGPWTVTFDGGALKGTPVEALYLVTNSLTGGTAANVSIIRTTPGVAPLPTIITFAGTLTNAEQEAFVLSTNALTGGTSPSATITEVTKGYGARGYFDAYADAGAGGLDTARGVLEYACSTDADGKITFGDVAGGADWGHTELTAPVIFGNADFDVADLTGLTAAAVADLGRMISGTYSNGILRMP